MKGLHVSNYYETVTYLVIGHDKTVPAGLAAEPPAMSTRDLYRVLNLTKDS